MTNRDEPAPTWVTLIKGAAAGKHDDRSLFSHRYLPVVRTYIRARWQNTAWIGELEDAVQEVFVECFREGGALGSYDAEREGGFRAYLFGVVRNVTLRIERRTQRRRQHENEAHSDVMAQCESRDEAASTLFDRAWAESIMTQAGERMAQNAMLEGRAARRRVELLELRFQDELPIREIAARWQVEAPVVHREYRRAREDFHAALRRVLAYHLSGAPEDLDQECSRLLALLG